MLFSVEEFSVCIVLTSCFCFASSVCFGFILVFVWLRQRLVSLSFKKSALHINLLEYFFFLEIDVCVYPSLCWLCSLSDILAMHDSNVPGRQIFHWSKLTMLNPWVQPDFGGGARNFVMWVRSNSVFPPWGTNILKNNHLTLTILNYSDTLLIWSPPGDKNLTVLTVTTY